MESTNDPDLILGATKIIRDFAGFRVTKDEWMLRELVRQPFQ